MKRVGVLSLLAVAAASHATVIDFESLPMDGDYYTSYGTSVTLDGFTFASVEAIDPTVSLISWQADGDGYTGSNALLLNFFADAMAITREDGGEFSLSAIDIANCFYYSPSNTLTLTGTRADSSTVSETVVLADGSTLSTYTFTTLTDLVSLSLEDSDPDYQTFQIDNVVFSDTEAVPEPMSMAVLGLGAAALIRRRRKA